MRSAAEKKLAAGETRVALDEEEERAVCNSCRPKRSCLAVRPSFRLLACPPLRSPRSSAPLAACRRRLDASAHTRLRDAVLRDTPGRTGRWTLARHSIARRRLERAQSTASPPPRLRPPSRTPPQTLFDARPV